MSIILQPQVAFPIVRQIANHLDATVYYVRAVMRDAQGVIIDTVALDSQGDQRYQASWAVPTDPTGRGSYISIVTSVYTDSGFTTKSPDYGDEETTYLIFDRVMPAMRGGGNATGIDSRTVRRIFQEEYEKIREELIPKPVVFSDMPKQEPARWDELLFALNSLKDQLQTLKPEKVDFKPLFDALESLRSDVNSLDIPKPTDIEPLMSKLDEKEQDDDLSRQEIVILLSQLAEELENELPEKIAKLLSETQFQLALIHTVSAPKEEKAQLFDLSKLSA